MIVSKLFSAWDRAPKSVELSAEVLCDRLSLFIDRTDLARDYYRNVAALRAGTAKGHLAERHEGKDLQKAIEDEAKFQKNRLAAWVPASFDGMRAKRNVQQVTCYVLDIEDGTTFDRACSMWPRFTKVVHTSWSHTRDNPRLRVVLPLKAPVPAVHWKKCWQYMYLQARKLGVQPDVKCSNADRIYFLPAFKSASAERRSFRCGDELLHLPWEAIPDYEPPRRRIVVRSPGASVRDFRDPAVRSGLAVTIGADTDGERAFHIKCPGCGRFDVYYFIEPERLQWAKCNHERSCGWTGPLAELESR